MSKITAIARIASADVSEYQPGETRLRFYAPYSDDKGNRVPENAVWAKYTPAFHLDMTVLSEVAAKFEIGKDYILTFEERNV